MNLFYLVVLAPRNPKLSSRIFGSRLASVDPYSLLSLIVVGVSGSIRKLMRSGNELFKHLKTNLKRLLFRAQGLFEDGSRALPTLYVEEA